SSAIFAILFSVGWILAHVLKLPIELLRRVFMLIAAHLVPIVVTEPGATTGLAALEPPTADDIWELDAPEKRGKDKWPKARKVASNQTESTVKVKPVPYQTVLIGEGSFGLEMLRRMLDYPSLSLTVKNKLRLVGYAPTDLNPDRNLSKLIRKSGAEDIS